MNRKEKKIIWIENTTNEFYTNISGIIPTNCKNLKVKLLSSFIKYPDANIFNASIIRVLCDFNVGHNQNSKYNNFIQLGIINNPVAKTYNCIEINSNDSFPTYSLYSIPELIFIKITNQDYGNLLSANTATGSDKINLCLKISYHI
jgi:hypothetical protein